MFSQPNNSDLFGNIHLSKNLNFDEEGYVKISPRSVSLLSSEDDTDFNIPVAFGRRQSGQFYIATIEDPFEIQIDDSAGITATQDADSGDPPPTFDVDSHGIWWENRWYVTADDILMYKTPSSGDWTDVGSITLTASVQHPLEIFERS